MTKSTPDLTAEQQQALEAGDGIVQGPSFVLLRTEKILDWFGYTDADIRRELEPALDQVEHGDVAEWNLQEFLAEMHDRHGSTN